MPMVATQLELFQTRPTMAYALCRAPPYVGYLLTGGAVASTRALVYYSLRVRPPLVRGAAASAIQPVLLGVSAAIPATQTLIMSKCVSVADKRCLVH
jgi:hypothetical protein